MKENLDDCNQFCKPVKANIQKVMNSIKHSNLKFKDLTN